MALRVEQAPLLAETQLSVGVRAHQAALVIEVHVPPGAGHLRVEQANLLTEISPGIVPHHLLQANQCYLILETGKILGLPVTLTGGDFQDFEGNRIAYGYLTANLIMNGAIAGTSKIYLDEDGSVIGGTTVSPNDGGVLAGSYYELTLHAHDGTMAWASQHTMTVASYPQTQNIVSVISLTP
jgi:hypothetical protein